MRADSSTGHPFTSFRTSREDACRGEESDSGRVVRDGNDERGTMNDERRRRFRQGLETLLGEKTHAAAKNEESDSGRVTRESGYCLSKYVSAEPCSAEELAPLLQQQQPSCLSLIPSHKTAKIRS